MKMKLLIIIAYLSMFAIFVPKTEASLIDFLISKFGDLIDHTFLGDIKDMLDPRNIIGTIDRQMGEMVKQVAQHFNLGGEVVQLALATVPQMIKIHGYPVEVHEVVTEDGYILQIHRIPYGRFGDQGISRGVVILGHGVLCSSACWLLVGPKRSLAYILADLGYDVWLTNMRGNIYGHNHTKYKTNVVSKFWDFSFHEKGKYDLPAIIDHVIEFTGQRQVYFVGHSESNTAFYIMCSERPEYNDKVRMQVSLAPVAHLKHMKNPFLYFLAQFNFIWEALLRLIGYNEFLPNNHLLRALGGELCKIPPLNDLVCANVMFVMAGFNRKNLNESVIPLIFGHTPAGTSLRTIIHFAQLIASITDSFEQFNHGLANLFVYGSLFPPKYDLGRVTTPVFCIYAHNDWLVSEKDVINTCGQMSNVEETMAVQDNEYTHNDFVYGSTAKEEVYNKVIEFMKRY